MTTTPELDHAPSRTMQIGFYVTSIVLNLCLIAQLITVGVAYFIDPEWWDIHVWLVRGYSVLPLILLGWSFLIPFSPRIRGLTAALPMLLVLQFVSIQLKSPLHLEVLHPLIGFSLLYVSSTLIHRVSQSLSATPRQPEQA